MVTDKQLETFKKAVAIELEGALQDVCPVDNGMLRESISVEIDGDELKVNMLHYGIYVDQGTGAHEITPKGKGFDGADPKAANIVYAKKVQHPGTKANPFIRNTFFHVLPRILNRNAERFLGVEVGVDFE